MRRSRFCLLLKDSRGSQIVEFAVALPLLIVFIVGIFDFGNAFDVKQKLNNAVRDAARLGSSLPTSDLTQTSTTPASISSIRSVLDSYLTASQLNDCGLNTGSPIESATLIWTYTASGNGCPAGSTLTLTIERGYSFQTTVNGNLVDVLSTRVSLSYPFQWHFGNVIRLLIPGANYAGVTNITTSAIVPNLD
jgi:Flp pilus assembly protein TadG